uniref:Trypsin inhibitor2 n=1 Tax=Oncidium hybrid cultivar TaxID=141207 RepID=F5BCP7_ONCHC|nr:trypsin inhibitor2 [Oncidium hybrid cultivar]
MELIKSSVGRSKSHLITLALLLLVADFFFLATTADHHHPTLSVLKLPTEANRTSIEKEEMCCDDCGNCQGIYIRNCECNDVLKECPSWCNYCHEENGGQRCSDMRPNYCEKKCAKEPEPCCDSCQNCNELLPDWCHCGDVLEECPSWCNECDYGDDGIRCRDIKEKYCENKCTSN